MIVVVGRPGLDERGVLDGLSARVAAAAAAAGGRTELLGSVGDDPDGDGLAVELGRAGVGHAALLRDPAATTPRGGSDEGQVPRLEAADIELGLRYLTDCRVLVIADRLESAALAAAINEARYHAARLVVINLAGGARLAETDLPADATVLEAPEEDAGAFARLVGRYAAQLDAGRGAAEAWQDALSDTGWESHAE